MIYLLRFDKGTVPRGYQLIGYQVIGIYDMHTYTKHERVLIMIAIKHVIAKSKPRQKRLVISCVAGVCAVVAVEIETIACRPIPTGKLQVVEGPSAAYCLGTTAMFDRQVA